MLLNFILSRLLRSLQFLFIDGDFLILANQSKTNKDYNNNEHKYKDKLCISLFFHPFNVTILEINWAGYSFWTKVTLRSIVRWRTSSLIVDRGYERLSFVTFASYEKIIYCVWFRFSQMCKKSVADRDKLNLLSLKNNKLQLWDWSHNFDIYHSDPMRFV